MRLGLHVTTIVGFIGATAWGQTASSGPTLYKLSPQSTYVEGCLPPCLCPAGTPVLLTGTFLLTPTQPDPLFSHYLVSAVNWTAISGGTTLHITGAGTYRIGGEVAVQQQLVLDLSINGGASTHFDSGLVSTGAVFPLIDISVSIKGMQCLDTVLHVVGAPAPAPVTLYHLGLKSTFEHGCFGPCECAIRGPVPITGTFLLVPAGSDPLYRSFSISDVRWTVHETSQILAITGSGTYRVGGEFALTQQLVLDLTVNGGTTSHFDSGVLPGGQQFPAIDVRITTDPTACYRMNINVQARPLGRFDVSATAVLTAQDLLHMRECRAGASIIQPVLSCQDADLDGDGDVDMDDFGIFQRCWSSHNSTVDPNCTN